MFRIMSAALAAAMFGSIGVAAAETTSHHSFTDRTVQPSSTYQRTDRWDRGVSGSTTPSATDRIDRATARDKSEFTSETDARAACRGDTVVWANTKTHVYHFAGNPAYGHTKHGAFMCRADADRSGSFRAAKTETAPARQ